MTAITAPLARHARTADGGRLLRLALRVDAAATGTMGIAALAGGSLLSAPLGAPTPALLAVGGFCVVYAIGLAALAARPSMPVPLVWTVVLCNLAWAVASIVTAAVAPLTVLGIVVTVAQGVAVAVFADVQWLGLRRLFARP